MSITRLGSLALCCVASQLSWFFTQLLIQVLHSVNAASLSVPKGSKLPTEIALHAVGKAK
jgi:hypothetical protein